MLREARKRNGHPMGLSKHFACHMKGKFRSDMTGGLIVQLAANHCWVLALGLILCLYGSRLHGCLLSLMPSGPKMCGGIDWEVNRALSPSLTLEMHLSLRQGAEVQIQKVPMDEEGHSPVLDIRANVDWLTLDTRTFYHSFPRLYEGILNDAFTQKTSMLSHPASPARVVVSLLLPGGVAVENWLGLARQKRNMWPLQMTMHTVGCSLPTEQFMQRERWRLKAKHLWAGLAPQWDSLRARMFCPCVTNLSREDLYARLFLLQFGTQQRLRETEYRGRDYWVVHDKWKQKQEWYKNAGNADSPSLLSIADYFTHFENADATSWEWIRWQEKSVTLVWHTKHGVYRRKEKADVRDSSLLVLQKGVLGYWTTLDLHWLARSFA